MTDKQLQRESKLKTSIVRPIFGVQAFLKTTMPVPGFGTRTVKYSEVWTLTEVGPFGKLGSSGVHCPVGPQDLGRTLAVVDPFQRKKAPEPHSTYTLWDSHRNVATLDHKSYKNCEAVASPTSFETLQDSTFSSLQTSCNPL